MKPCLRFLLGAVLALFGAAAAHAQLSPTGLSASPGSALPGDGVTFTVTVSNGGAQSAASADFTVKLTNLVTLSTITLPTAVGVTPTGGFIAGAVAAAPPSPATPGTGTFVFTTQIPASFSEAGNYSATVTMSTGAPASFSVSTSVLTITGKPDLQITSLTYAAGTSYVGGTVIPMQLTYVNNSSTNGTNNVPYVPGTNGFPTFVRVQVVLSSNPTFGDADDFQLTILDINGGNIGTTDNRGNPAVAANAAGGNPAVNADGVTHTFNWNQILPGNFSGSYYVLAKIDSLNQLPQNDPPALNVNGNNVWGGNTLNPSGTLINLIPSNFPTVYLASHGKGVATTASGYSDNPSMTADGRYMAFASDATNLVDATSTGGADTNGVRDIFIFDSQTSLVRRLSLSQQGAQGNGASNNPAISSANGRYVAFESNANNLVLGDTNGFSDIFVVDTLTGLISRISGANATGGQANNPSFKPSISQTGRFVVFQSTATNLTATATSVGRSHIYLYDRDVSGTGTFDTVGNTSTTVIDVPTAGTESDRDSIQPAISADGTVVAFTSDATNLDPNAADTNGKRDVFVRNVSSNTTRRVSVVNGTAAEADGDSQTPSLSSDGHYVAFASLADNLVAGDGNVVSDIFVYDTTALVTAPVVTRMSVSSANAQGSDPSAAGFRLGSINPTISSDGRYVTFASLDDNLASGDTNGQFHDGAYATATAAAPVAGALTTIAVTNGGSGYLTPPAVRITGGGGTGGYATATLTGNAVTSITVVNPGTGYTATPTVALIADSGDANKALDIFVHDRQVSGSGAFDASGNTATQMVSVNPFGYQTNGLLGSPSTAASNIYPVISANGRFVAFPSDAENNSGFAFGATNLLPLDSNTLRDVFLFDRRTNAPVTQATPPTVTITNPGNGSAVLVNTVIPVTASATTTIGVVSSVQFFVNGTSLGTSTVFPYTQSWTPTAVGTYTLSALVTDSFGNLGVSSNITVTVNAAPSVGITSPVAGSSVTTNSVNNFTATAAASNPGATITGVQFFANGVSLGTDTTAPYSITWSPASTGNYSLTVVATDSVGTQTTSPAVAITVTTAGSGGGGGAASPPPAVSLFPVPPTAASVNLPITLTANANAANGFNLTGVEYFANGVSLGSATAYPYALVWTPVATGFYTITAKASDNVGTTATSAGATVSVTAGTAPVVSLLTPNDGSAAVVGGPITLSAVAALGSGLFTGVEFFANGVSIGTRSVSTTGQGALPFYNLDWTPAAAGTYAFYAVGTDTSGNRYTTPTVTVTVSQNSAPSVSLTSPLVGASYTLGTGVLLSASAGDSDGTVASVQFFANGVPLITVSAAPYTFSWLPPAAGTYQITARATDNSGGVTTTAPRAVTVTAGAAATVTIVNPSAGSSIPVGNTVPFVASVTGGNGPITQVQFFVNGSSIGTASTSPYSTQWTPGAPGSYTLLAVATDSAGVSVNSTAQVVTITANNPPTVAITLPATGTTVSAGTVVTLVASAGDSDGTVASVRFLANGNTVATATAVPYLGSWTPTAAGIYAVVAQATDNSGNVTNSVPIILSVSANQIPSVALTSPANGATVRVGVGVTLNAAASDADGTITNVQFFANGVAIGTSTTPPYTTIWTPGAEGLYRLNALTIDNSGAVAVSTTVLVLASASAGDSVATGTYQGAGEVGNFAVVTSRGKAAAYIGYSITAGVNKTYFFPNVPADSSGNFSLLDSAGKSLIAGASGDTGTSGNVDAGRLTFIGIDTKFLAGSGPVAAGYYAGTLTGKTGSTLAAIIGSDGSIMLYAANGTFDDAGGGGLTGKLDNTGAFSVTTLRGNRFTGKADPLTGFISGTLTGSNGGAFSAAPAVLGATSSAKVSGAAAEIGSNITVASTGFTYDQVLLKGASASVTADPGQITRVSFADLTNDIVQVEFSGAGVMSITLDNPSGPATAANYNQPDIAYMKGHANILITGADETSNVSVFSVGKLTAVNQTLFKSGVVYDGVADIGYIAILTTDGKFGGIRTANASYLASKGITGICAPGVQFTGPVYLGDINAADIATPVLLLGSASDVRVTGGDLFQSNNQPVQVSGIGQLRFTDGTTSQGLLLPAQADRSRLEENGADVTSRVVVNPSP